MTATCPRCQAQVQDGDKFCSNCGKPMATRAATPAGYHPVPGATGQPDLRTRKKRRARRPWYRKPFVMALMILALIVIAGSAGAMFYIQQRFQEINAISTPPPVVSINDDDGESSDVETGIAQEAVDAANSGDEGGQFSLRPVSGSEGDSRTILLMGVDARPGESIDAGVRPDSLSVMHLNSDTGSCRILSIPRDTRVELPGYGQSKINHALAVGGIPYEALVVEQFLGVQIDHFALIDFSGVEELVDAVGGVTVTNERAFEIDEYSFPEGQLTLDGAEALAYARFRGDEEGDFGRQRRQQQIIRALMSQTGGMDVVTGANQLLGAVEGHFKTDLSPTEMIDLANDYRSSCTSETLETTTMDGAIETHPDPLLDLNLSYVVIPDNEVQQRVAWLKGED